MIGCANCYNFIGKANFDKLTKLAVLPTFDNFLIESFPINNKYGLIIEELKKAKKDQLIEFLTKEYIEKYGLNGFVSTSIKPITRVRYDMIYGTFLIDIKAYKKEFTKSQFDKFILQLSLYYLYLYTNTKITHIIVINPVLGKQYKCPVDKINLIELKKMIDTLGYMLDKLLDISNVVSDKENIVPEKEKNILPIKNVIPEKKISSVIKKKIPPVKDIITEKKIELISKKVINPITGNEISISGKVFKDLVNKGYKYDEIKNILVSNIILNPETGKSIKIGGSTYDKLIKKGYKLEKESMKLML